jgi:hypothetical protein
MRESRVYKGYKIVEQWRKYDIWDGDTCITDYEAEFDAYIVWDDDNNQQHEGFPEAYDSIDEAKAAVDKFVGASV